MIFGPFFSLYQLSACVAFQPCYLPDYLSSYWTGSSNGAQQIYASKYEHNYHFSNIDEACYIEVGSYYPMKYGAITGRKDVLCGDFKSIPTISHIDRKHIVHYSDSHQLPRGGADHSGHGCADLNGVSQGFSITIRVLCYLLLIACFTVRFFTHATSAIQFLQIISLVHGIISLSPVSAHVAPHQGINIQWHDSCDTCPAGNSCSGSEVKQCEAGRYSLQNECQCYFCLPGEWSAPGSDSCSACQAGYQCDSGEMTLCGEGEYAPPGSDSCLKCGKGHFTTNMNESSAPVIQTGASYCIECPAGYACNGSTRIMCPAGRYSGPGQAECAICGDGYWSNHASQTCYKCPAGNMCKDGQIQICEAGTASRAGSTTCTECEPGSYSDAGQERCQGCGEGTYSEIGSPSCINCPDGMWSSEKSENCSLLCEAGYICRNGSRTACEDGSYSGEGASECSACNKNGNYTTKSHTICAQCGVGYRSTENHQECEKCPPGTEWKSWVCVPCDEGSYSSVGEKCSPCGEATYAADINGVEVSSGAVQCLRCPAGSECGNGKILGRCSPGTVAAEGDGVCRPCEGADYQPAEGQGQCLTCGIGRHTEGESSNTMCIICSPGHWCNGNAETECSAGSYSSQGAATCTACELGTATHSNGSVSCDKCSKRQFPAKYNSQNAPVSSSGALYCVLCPGGYACDGTKKTRCAFGGYSTSGSGVCQTCGPTSSARADGISCDSCEEGSYSAFHAFMTNDTDFCQKMTARAYNGRLQTTRTDCEIVRTADNDVMFRCGLRSLNIVPRKVTLFVIGLGLEDDTAAWLRIPTNKALVGGACDASSESGLTIPPALTESPRPSCRWFSLDHQFRQSDTSTSLQSTLLSPEHLVPVRDSAPARLTVTIEANTTAYIFDPDATAILNSSSMTLSTKLDYTIDPLLWLSEPLGEKPVTLNALSARSDCSEVSVIGAIEATVPMSRQGSMCRGSVQVLPTSPPAETTLRANVSMSGSTVEMHFPALVVPHIGIANNVVLRNDMTWVEIPISVAPSNAEIEFQGCSGVTIERSNQTVLRSRGVFDRHSVRQLCNLTLSIPGYTATVTVATESIPRNAELDLRTTKDDEGLLLGIARFRFIDSEQATVRGDIAGVQLCFNGSPTVQAPAGTESTYLIRPCKTVLARTARITVTATVGGEDFVSEGTVTLPMGSTVWIITGSVLGAVAISCVAVFLLIRARKRQYNEITSFPLSAEIMNTLYPLLLNSGDLELSSDGLGAGGFGRVVRGSWHGVGVAIKLMHASLANDPDALTSVAQEGVIQSSLRHPNIVQLFGVAVIQGSLALVLELCNGGLQKAVYGKSYDEVSMAQRLCWLHEAAQGLTFMHTRGIMHRDIKAANILLAGGHAKVTDLGLAREGQGMPAAGMTLALGTPAWCAPEVIERDRYDERAADVYAFGIMIWEVLTGSEPFADVPVLAITIHVLRGSRPPIPSNWPMNVSTLIQACWSANPEDRPAMANVAQSLGTLCWQSQNTN